MRPASRGSGASETRSAPPPSAGAFGGGGGGGVGPAIFAAKARFSRDVGARPTALTRVAEASGGPPPRTNRFGTPSNAAPPCDPVPPAARFSGPAENPADRDPGGAGSSGEFDGLSPTIASDA